MTKKHKFLTLILVALLFFSGCASAITPESTEASSELDLGEEEKDLISKLKTEGDHIYGQLTDKISVDFENANLFNNPNKYAELDVKKIDLNYQALADAFFGKSVKLNISNDEKVGLTVTYNDKLNNSFNYNYFTQGELVNVNAFSDFSFQTENIFRNSLRNGIGGFSAQWNTTKFFKTNEDLSFMPVRDATNEVVNVLKKGGLKMNAFTLCNEKIYSLSKEHLKEAEEYLDKLEGLKDYRTGKNEVKGTWKEEDECYYMELNFGYKNLPIYTKDGINKIEVIYNKEGIRSIGINIPLDFVKENSKPQELISVNEAFEHLIKYYDAIINKWNEKIVDCYLCYYPWEKDEGFVLVPAWFIDVELTKDSEYQGDEVLFLNAITGEWLSHE